MDNYDPNNWNDNNNTNQNQNINGNQHPNQNYFNNDYPVPPAKPKDKLASLSLFLCLGISGIVLMLFFFVMMLSILHDPSLINYMQEYMSVYAVEPRA